LSVSGSNSLGAKDGSLVAESSAFDVGVGAGLVGTTVTHIVFVEQPSNAIAGDAINPSIVVDLEDGSKNIATNNDSIVTLSIKSGPAGASLGGTTSLAADNGIATFSDILLETAGHYRLMASEGDLVVASKTITILPAAAANVNFVQEPVNVVAGHQFSSRIEVSVTDAFGNAVANGTEVTLAVDGAPGGGAIFGKTAAVTHNGIARFSNVTLRTAGDYTLTALAGSVSAQSVSFAVSPAAASRMAFILPPGDSLPDTPFDVQIELLDKYGNVATNDSSTVTVTLRTHPVHALLSGTNSAAVTDGLAVFSGLSLQMTGAYSLRFADGGLHLISPSFNIA